MVVDTDIRNNGGGLLENQKGIVGQQILKGVMFVIPKVSLSETRKFPESKGSLVQK